MFKVLIAEDDPQCLKALKSTIDDERPEWILTECKTVAEAMNQISQFTFDAVITDWMFEGERQCGKDILAAAVRRDAFTMVLVITDYDDKFDRYKDALELGAYDVIPKIHPNPKRQAFTELLLKADAALRFRSLYLKASAYSRHLDSSVTTVYEKQAAKLNFCRRLVTICFLDLRGFSAVNKALLDSNELVAEFLRHFYSVVVRVTHSYQGIVDKFMGDGAMLLFGALETEPKADGDEDAMHAVQAVLGIRGQIEPLILKFTKQFNRSTPGSIIELELGAGIHTAVVLAGVITTEIGRDQFTALGHGVNLAQRFEAASGRVKPDGQKRGSVIVSKTVKERVEGQVILRPEGELTDMKNQDPHPAWSVVGLKGVA